MKTTLTLFALAFMAIGNATAQSNLNDTLRIQNDSTSYYISSDSTMIDLSPVSSAKGEKSGELNMSNMTGGDMILDFSVPDSIMNELLGDTVSVEKNINQIEQQINSLPMDSASIDSLVRMKVHQGGSIDSLAIDSIKPDSVKALPADTLSAGKTKAKISKPKEIPFSELPSVKELNRIYLNYRRYVKEANERWDDYYFSYLDNDYVNPDFYKFVVPITYYSSAFVQATSIEGWKPKDVISEYYDKRNEWFYKDLPDLRVSEKVDRAVNRQLLTLYTTNLRLVTRNEAEYKNLNILSDKELKAEKHKENIIELAQNNAGIAQVSESDLIVFKPNFWSYGGNGYLQFSQNYISDNWYKGGESTKSLLSGFTWQAKYDDKQKTQFENKIEWKLGFITAPSDTVHTYKANNDLLRLSSKLGYKAIWNWYYTLSAEFQTQLFSSYETNSDKLVSALLSPATLNVGLGMDYKYVKDGIINLSVLVNPLNYTLYSVMSDEVDPTKFNIKAGHKMENVIGSRLDATMTWKVFNSLMWESKLSYNTNYESVLASWENTFTFIVNKYLSTKLFVHARYDDNVSKEPDDSYFQLQELFSFGLNYTW